MGRIVAWDELSLGTNCRLGRIVAWDELSLGTNCRLGRIVAWDELSLGTNCRLGRIVAWDELSLGTNCRPTIWNTCNHLLLRAEESLQFLKECVLEFKFCLHTLFLLITEEETKKVRNKKSKWFHVFQIWSFSVIGPCWSYSSGQSLAPHTLYHK